MMMKRILRAPDAYPLALLLAFVGGYLDAYTYITRDGVFANAQTGNMALMALRLARGEWADALHYLVPIAAFALGIFGVREARYHMQLSQDRVGRGNPHPGLGELYSPGGDEPAGQCAGFAGMRFTGGRL